MKDLQITEGDYRMVRVGDLVIDQAYQRKVNKNMIRRIVNDYDRHLLDAIRVSYRDGMYRVLDGQHRTVAIRDYLGNEDSMVWCQVFYDIENYEAEARLFTKQQSSRKLSALESYKARVEARDPDLILLQNILELNGFHATSSTKDYNLGCVTALEKILRDYGPEIMDHTFRLIHHTWNGNKPFLTAPIIRAIAVILSTYEDLFDDDVFVRALSVIPIGQLKREALSGVTTREYHVALVNFYNKKTTKKLNINAIRRYRAKDIKEYDK